jgi:hypothetical protein
MAMVDPNLCVQCHMHPRLRSLSRCSHCVRAAAEEDRQSRQAAESRLARRRSAKEAEARTTAERHAALEKLGELYLQFAASPEGIRLAEAQQSELTAPRNDPAYLQTLEDHEKDRTQVANVTATVHHTVDSGRSWLSIGLTNPRDHAAASDAARVLGRHLEAPVIRHEDSKDATRLADRKQVQPAKHTFGREKRSLGNSAPRTATGKRRA